MLRTLAVATLAMLAFAAPAQAQKQEYPAWMFDEMVPTGPHMRHMEQAQPVPGARPSHWGAMGTGEQHRAGMRQYGTDATRTNRNYARTQSLTPPVRDGRATAAPIAPPPDLVPAAPREVVIQR